MIVIRNGERRCGLHPRYQAIREPRIACRDCWILYLGMCDTCVNCGCQESEREGGIGFAEIYGGGNDNDA